MLLQGKACEELHERLDLDKTGSLELTEPPGGTSDVSGFPRRFLEANLQKRLQAVRIDGAKSIYSGSMTQELCQYGPGFVALPSPHEIALSLAYGTSSRGCTRAALQVRERAVWF